MSKHRFSVEGPSTMLDGKPTLCRGLRCSNALYSEQSADDLITNLDTYRAHGVNCISVFFMGNRFGDIPGYREDATLDPTYAARMARILEAADEQALAVLVGCLYWGESRGKHQSWTQKEANAAVRNTVEWLATGDYRHTFVDVDNEGMARASAGFDNRELVLAAKQADQEIPVATNYVAAPPDEADLTLHFSDHGRGKPHIESEGTPENAPGGYWHHWSRKHDPNNRYRRDPGYWNYINVGRYTEDMRRNQLEVAESYFDRGDGYLLASTWLQAVPPLGPNHSPGGMGGEKDPGILWWLQWLEDRFGAWEGQ